MKKLSLFLCLTLMLSLVFGATAGAWVSAAENGSVTEFKVEADVKTDPLEVTIDVPQDGTYALGFEYKALDDKISDLQVSIKIDGKFPNEALEDIVLPRYWTTDEPYRVDGQGNQFSAEQVMYKDFVTYYLLSSADFEVQPYVFDLTAGKHKVTITPIVGEFNLKSIKLDSATQAKKYQQPALTDKNAYYGEDIVFEGEAANIKSSYWLTTGSDISSSKVSPADPIHSKINYVGGSTWKEIGSTIYWTVNVPQAGYYNLGFSYRQSYVLNGNTYRWLQVNGKTPFEEATSIAFPYATDWEVRMLGATEDGENIDPYAVYLEKGDNQISMTTTLGEYAAVCTELDEVVLMLGDLYLDITMVTGETVDIYRDYRLFDQIPRFEERLKEADAALAEVDEKLVALAHGETSNYSACVRNTREVIQRMLDNRFDAHRYKSSYYSNYSSLSANLNDMQDMPLDIDQIILTSVEADKITGKTDKNFFVEAGEKLVFGVERFIASFTQDYNNISGVASDSNESVTVWVNWGRDQAQVLNMLVQSSFSQQQPNIAVSIKISNATMIQGVLSGNGPDVTLMQSRTEPVNLAMRGVLYDMSQFKATDPEYDAVMNRFHAGAIDPYLYRDGLYALPDSQSFLTMFYRTDVFEELELEAPKTWDEFRTVARILTRNNLDAWLPYTQITDMSLVNAGVGNLNLFPTLLMQNGLSLYNDELSATSFTAPEVIAVFTDWTDYYTKLKLPYQLDFFTRFRIGTCPIGIAPYTTYNTLRDSAKEIDGKWRMVEIPGVMQADGTINNASAGSGTGCAILKGAKSPEAAWTFLKWWTDADTQLKYSNNLESILGPVGRVAVSNVDALKSMAWDVDSLNTVLAAWDHVKEIREVPGSYYVARSLDFAFWNVASMSKNPKDMMQTWGEEADAEIKRKLEQYENR